MRSLALAQGHEKRPAHEEKGILSQREESNLRPMVYETIALPLSYAGGTIGIIAG